MKKSSFLPFFGFPFFLRSGSAPVCGTIGRKVCHFDENKADFAGQLPELWASVCGAERLTRRSVWGQTATDS